MQREIVKLGSCEFEILKRGDLFVGLGEIWIGEVQVRSGRLPLCVYTQSFGGQELAAVRLAGVDHGENEIRVRLEAEFHPLPVKLMRDHSFDPIHETGDWDAPAIAGVGQVDLVLKLATDSFEGVQFEGFSYHYEYRGETPLFYLLDMASWELDGDIEGATVVSQSSCSAPVARFEADTAWSTEGIIHFADPNAAFNTVMTHNLPRWASHQAFDFQFKGANTLIGVFERVDLVRTLLQREAGKAELKTFDKHIFDQTTEYTTSPKKILINSEGGSEIGRQNLWTWVMDATSRRARAEFGLREEPLVPRIGHNFWENFTVDSYLRDLIPAAINIGAKAIFVDNLNKSSMTTQMPSKEFHWNMCCGHEYELAPELGGTKVVARFVKDCAEHGIQVISWTNNDQSYCSPLSWKPETSDWHVKMEDTRLKYGGAYTNCFTILNFKKDGPRQYWVDCLKKTKEESGLGYYLFDSFYNLGFMPVDYSDCTPTTQWRELLHAFKELQDSGVGFLIESFGPFGQPQHGCPRSYNVENMFACYKVGMGSGYTTVPTGEDTSIKQADEVSRLYYILAHMTDPGMPLFIKEQRIDTLWTAEHKRALADYNTQRASMYKRILQEDGKAVLWHDEAGKRATLWNFADRTVSLPGKVTDLSTGEALAETGSYSLSACHTYGIAGAELPGQVG